ncbi:DUF3180 domain-containing protein [Corynebacterium epidermidicanis]|uniref:Putative DUF3180 family protein n=1 Tax=Corynebacterium epidermidicanis TaxID=1050174 RepID=A0A0G3GS15_9CORY|nr:DUF3180 domain-containing protein [Corynebacterium epidermidicanis]AKK03986.1 putative DUF3180 family protein [Corynebacterium epidermidicanis]
MKLTSIPGLIGSFIFFLLAAFILSRAYYGQMGPVSIRATFTLWFLAAVCVILSLRVRERKEKGEIGLDRSQLSPLVAANFLVIGKATSWTGAIVGGCYAGLAAHVLPNIGQLTAAANDAPAVISGTLGGICAAIAGVYLDRNCETPPPTDGEAA